MALRGVLQGTDAALNTSLPNLGGHMHCLLVCSISGERVVSGAWYDYSACLHLPLDSLISLQVSYGVRGCNMWCVMCYT